jgi:hypothetical protein
MSIGQTDLENWFACFRPKDGEKAKYEAISQAGLALATAILVNTPESADQATAIRKVRESVMTAHASISCQRKLDETEKTTIEEYPMDEHINETGHKFIMGNGAGQYRVKPGEKMYPRGGIIVRRGGLVVFDGPPPPEYDFKPLPSDGPFIGRLHEAMEAHKDGKTLSR